MEGAFLIKHSSPLHRGIVSDIMANPTTALKIISNFDVFSTANISDCLPYFLGAALAALAGAAAVAAAGGGVSGGAGGQGGSQLPE